MIIGLLCLFLKFNTLNMQFFYNPLSISVYPNRCIASKITAQNLRMQEQFKTFWCPVEIYIVNYHVFYNICNMHYAYPLDPRFAIMHAAQLFLVTHTLLFVSIIPEQSLYQSNNTLYKKTILAVIPYTSYGWFFIIKLTKQIIFEF